MKTLIIPIVLSAFFVIPLTTPSLAQQMKDDANQMEMKQKDMKMDMGGRPDMVPPPGIMGGHQPKQGKFMAGLSGMYMAMDGNRSGTRKLGDGNVLNAYMVAPLNMSMKMIMGSAMYGLTDEASVMAMVPYIEKRMEHINRAGVRFNTKAKGFGDIKVVAGYRVFRKGPHSIRLGGGFSLPTGSIDERDDTPVGTNQILPYPMQLGSGTVDFIPSLTYTGMGERTSWGAQVVGTFRLGENDRDYTFGNVYQANLWGGLKVNRWAGVFARLQGEIERNIDGRDTELNAAMVPTADPSLRGGRRINFSAGVNLAPRFGSMDFGTLGLEFGMPLYQNLKGPQMQQNYTVGLGWKKTF